MAEHGVDVSWTRGDQTFTDNRYSRRHQWHFDGGVDVTASASPHVVPLPYSCEKAVDPEEAFVASLSSCHMLWFLSIAAQQGFTVDHYHDQARGIMGRDESGRIAMTEVTLRPRVTFCGERQPTAAEHEHMHERAHDACFIASSVRTRICCEPVMA
ncbi:MAG: OsmC family protein [Steroidobacteraceae bacterium]